VSAQIDGGTGRVTRQQRPIAARWRRAILESCLRQDESGGKVGVQELASGSTSVHTAIMNLKNAAFLALIALSLLSVLLLADLITNALGVLRDIIPAMALLKSLVYTFASVSLAVFFYVFHKTQS
jgi:hypothetical protein